MNDFNKTLFELSSAIRTNFIAKAPDTVNLLPFQHVGVEYLVKAKKALLADVPGVGKTIQAISFMDTVSIDRYLVICPASLQDNWRREILKWSTGKYEPYIFKNGRETPRNSILILSYGLCTNYDLLARILKNYMFDGLIVDECHFIKSFDARRSQLLYAKNGPFDRAEYIAALSGTPVLNKPVEIFPIVNKLNPKVFEETELEAFGNKYCETRRNVFSGRIEYKGARNEKELNFKLRSNVMCRRLKEDVLKDLPPKIKRILYLEQTSVSLNYTAKEHDLYAAFLNTGTQTREDQQSMFHVRTILGLLKVEAIVNHAKMILMEQEKILIFGWHREVLARVSAGLAEYNPVVLTGATYISDRQMRCDSFQTDPSRRVFVGSISAAGVGLNLQAASHVIFGEMSWLPSENEQSEDRCHRIGQHNSVVIDYLIFENSVDEHVLKVTSKKSEIIKKVLDVKDTTLAVNTFVV